VEPSQILENAYRRARNRLESEFITDETLLSRINDVCRHPNNRSPVRMLLACCTAKIHNPSVDIRKPFTELGERSFSGRTYDERYVSDFVNKYELPCNPTTAFLTPAFRTKPVILEPGTELGGRPRRLYMSVIELLDAVENSTITADDLLAQTIKTLLAFKEERQHRMQSLMEELKRTQGDISLSSEDIVELLKQHLSLPHASRLPVLMVAAIYQSAADNLGERVLPLRLHNAADEQTGALGDLEITLVDDDQIVTSYEIKMKQVLKADVDRALQKLTRIDFKIDNYIFVTTDIVDRDVSEYARSLYSATGGIEFAILDCIDFLRHFLHLFHRLRIQFLEKYQELLLSEPESAVRQELKEAFLSLRRAAESSYLLDRE